MLIALYSPVEQSGKSEVAKALVAERGFKLVKFADGLKRVAWTVLQEVGVPEALIFRYLEGDLKSTVIPELGISGRVLMQRTGTDYGRDLIHPQLWVRATYRKLRAHAHVCQDVVIDDLRHENELEMVLKAGGFPLKIVRPGATKYNEHPSEGLLDRVPLPRIVNNGTLEQLHEVAVSLPERLKGGLF